VAGHFEEKGKAGVDWRHNRSFSFRNAGGGGVHLTRWKGRGGDVGVGVEEQEKKKNFPPAPTR